jgi:hypothetical protein
MPIQLLFSRDASRVASLPSTNRSAEACKSTRLLHFSAAALLLAMLTGCAAPGDPVARHPIIPLQIRDLTARQLGNAVVLTFTLPVNATDQNPLAAPPEVEIYRTETARAAVPQPPSAADGAATPRLVDTIPGTVVKNYENNGRIEFSDTLEPAEIAQYPGEEWRYFVRTRISQKRPSSDSNTVALNVYPTPEAITDVHATVMETEISLVWSAPSRTAAGDQAGAIARYDVYRSEIPPDGANAATHDPVEAKSHSTLALIGQASGTEYHDVNINLDHTYMYVVRSLVQAGATMVQSSDSEPLVVTAKDVFPPAAPQGVEAVASPATIEGAASIEVVWTISPEPDLAGYVVNRSNSAADSGERLTPELLSAPTFRDINVTPGQRYFYHVRAVDRDGNESPATVVTAEAPER